MESIAVFITVNDDNLEKFKHCRASLLQYCSVEFKEFTVILNDDGDSCALTKKYLKSVDQNFVVSDNASIIENVSVRGQYLQLIADNFLNPESGIKFICFMDASMICYEPEVFDKLFSSRSKKPIMHITPYSSLLGRDGAHIPEEGRMFIKKNREITSDFICEKAQYEFVRRMPLVFPIEIFLGLRKFIKRQHDVDMIDYLKTRDSFSALNALGAFSYKYYQEMFEWLDTTKASLDTLPVYNIDCNHLRFFDADWLPIETINCFKKYPEINTLLKKFIEIIHKEAIPALGIPPVHQLCYSNEKVLSFQKAIASFLSRDISADGIEVVDVEDDN